jgi:hypothetical protein
MDWLMGDHMKTPTGTHATTEELYFLLVRAEGF